jgi:hypothetical protein
MDDPNSPLHKINNHNTLRATRLIEALKMFGYDDFGLMKELTKDLLFTKHYDGNPSQEYWLRAYGDTVRIHDY